MRDHRFEWDDAKAESNAYKHGVTFEEATGVFDDLNALIEPDDDEPEERDTTIGLAFGNLLFVVSTDRSYRIRIISARRANRHEQDRYYRQALSQK
jgi:uncharacterized protein